ncbi:RidA family protein [Tautonia sociabilis]|uniref:RidA family protein n=1 Tax=Tautonia sociabilis TaxID=2080755 RepID=A0A432MK26_9BACT|nr:RidA family protein [Tautonia sociabilis]RUL87535.1 RidA family protein [Tautonia sociabilis]
MRQSVHVTVSSHGPRLLASTGSPWEPKAGYARAVRIGSTIAVTGTIGLEADGSLPPTAGAQARRALAIVLASIEALGGTASDVIRTRIYVTDISKFEEIAAEHAEVFAAIRPALTMVEVARLILPGAFVEIEADAIVSEGT